MGPESDGGLNPIMKFGVLFGVPGLIAVYLVWLLGSSLSAKVSDLDAKFGAHMETTGAMRQILEDQKLGQRTLNAVTLQLCVNTAKTASDRNGCIEASIATK